MIISAFLLFGAIFVIWCVIEWFFFIFGSPWQRPFRPFIITAISLVLIFVDSLTYIETKHLKEHGKNDILISSKAYPLKSIENGIARYEIDNKVYADFNTTENDVVIKVDNNSSAELIELKYEREYFTQNCSLLFKFMYLGDTFGDQEEFTKYYIYASDDMI